MKSSIISVVIAILIIGGALMLISSNGDIESTSKNVNNVSVVEGKQLIQITAKGGYLPRKSIAKSGMQTIIRFNTAGTFDCSVSVRIPSLNISKLLSPNGATDIDIGISEEGILRGSCSMGMYPFEIEFK